MNIIKSIAFRSRPLRRKLSYCGFAAGGKSIRDKIAAFYLRGSMASPFETRPAEVLKRISRKGQYINLRHRYFNYLQLSIDLLDNFEVSICYEFFLEHTYDLKKIKFTPERIIDGGAYRGYFTLLAHAYFPQSRITAIEAHPANYEKTRNTLLVNNIHNVEVLHAAISAIPGEIELFFEGSSGSLENTFSNSSKVRVQTVNLFDYIKTDRLLLKIDIEGAELDFFPAIIEHLPPLCAVFFETHDTWISLGAIRDKFIEAGFSFEVIRERGQFIDCFAQRV